MTHSEKRAHWVKEGAIGLGVGVLYGLTNTCVGHPWDTLKTKMQAQAGYEKTGMFQTFVKTLKTQGPIGLYRGCIPPLWGSGIYRSTQFAVFEGVYTFLGMRSPIWHYEIPFTAGLQLRVLAAGSVASTARAIIETPLEFAKIRRQTQQTWQLRKVYTTTTSDVGTCPIGSDMLAHQCSLTRAFTVSTHKVGIRKLTSAGTLVYISLYAFHVLLYWASFSAMGLNYGFGVTWVRTMGLMCSYFILVDTGRRNFPEHFKRPILGPFLISGVSATLGWWIVWPFEYMKSQVQSGYLGKDMPVWKRMAIIIREKGFFSLYRGILPGTIRSFLANGTSMVVMTFAQRKVSQLGLRK